MTVSFNASGVMLML